MGTYAESLLTPDERILRRERQHPIALVLDDAQNASQADRRVLHELARRFDSSAFLMVVGRQARESGEAPFFEDGFAHDRIEFGALPAAAIDALLTHRGSGHP